jgi:hypothetical protein
VQNDQYGSTRPLRSGSSVGRTGFVARNLSPLGAWTAPVSRARRRSLEICMGSETSLTMFTEPAAEKIMAFRIAR